MRASLSCAAFVATLLSGCASSPDHFYTLSTLPEGARGALSPPIAHVILTLSVPALVDRAEMVISTARNGILVLDHERWAVPLSEQVSQTLARDIEKLRSDILIGDRGFDQPGSTSVVLKVDIVRMAAQRGGKATIEAHWRVFDSTAGADEIGSAVFEAPVDGQDYASIAKAYSETLSALAAKIAAEVHRR